MEARAEILALVDLFDVVEEVQFLGRFGDACVVLAVGYQLLDVVAAVLDIVGDPVTKGVDALLGRSELVLGVARIGLHLSVRVVQARPRESFLLG